MFESLKETLAWFDHTYRGVDIKLQSITDSEKYGALEITVEAGLYTIKYLFPYQVIYAYTDNPKQFLKTNYVEVIEMAHYYINQHWNEYTIHGNGD